MCPSVICSWKQIVFSILVGSLAKKLRAGWANFHLVKNAFLKTFFSKYKRSFFFNDETPLKWRGL